MLFTGNISRITHLCALSCARLRSDYENPPGWKCAPPIQKKRPQVHNLCGAVMLLGAGANAIVPVRVGARVVAILVAQADVATVVVVAAAPGETLNHRTIRPRPIHGTFPLWSLCKRRFVGCRKIAVSRYALLPFFLLLSSMAFIQPPISLPISTTISTHTP